MISRVAKGDPYINSDCDEIFRAIICRQKATLQVFPEYLLEFLIFCVTLLYLVMSIAVYSIMEDIRAKELKYKNSVPIDTRKTFSKSNNTSLVQFLSYSLI